MGKRFVDTELYDQEWFLALPPRLKVAWNILCARCNVIGVWHISLTKLSFEVGEPVTLEELRDKFKVTFIDDDKLFIPGFVAFQYGDEAGRLSAKNKFHLSVAEKLKSLGLPEPEWKPIEIDKTPIGHPVDTLSTGDGSTQGRGRGRGKGQGNSSEGECEGKQSAMDFLAQLPVITQDTLRTKYQGPALEQAIEDCRAYYANDPGSNAWPMGTWGKKVTGWIIENKRRDKGKPKSQSLDDLVLPDYSTKEPA